MVNNQLCGANGYPNIPLNFNTDIHFILEAMNPFWGNFWMADTISNNSPTHNPNEVGNAERISYLGM